MTTTKKTLQKFVREHILLEHECMDIGQKMWSSYIYSFILLLLEIRAFQLSPHPIAATPHPNTADIYLVYKYIIRHL